MNAKGTFIGIEIIIKSIYIIEMLSLNHCKIPLIISNGNKIKYIKRTIRNIGFYKLVVLGLNGRFYNFC